MSGLPERVLPDRAAYDYLTRTSRADLAWEWLRRNPDYRRLAPGVRRQTDYGWIIDAAPADVSARWGCLHVENPERRAGDTSIIWSAAFDRSALRLVASPASGLDRRTFDLRRHATSATIAIDAGRCENILIGTRAGHHVRLDVVAGTLLDGPVTLHLDLAAVGDLRAMVTSLQRLFHLWEDEALPGRVCADRGPWPRPIDALCVYDALTDGATIRDIGIILFGRDRIVAEWRAPGESLKSCCRRKIAFVRYMAEGGYKTLLR